MEWPKLELFKNANKSNFKWPDIGKLIEDQVGELGTNFELPIKDLDFTKAIDTNGLTDGLKLDQMGSTVMSDFDIPKQDLSLNGELFNLGDIGVDLGDANEAGDLDMGDIGADTLTIDLKEVEDETDDVMDEDYTMDDFDLKSELSGADLKSELGDLGSIEDLGVSGSELGLGFNPMDIFKGSGGGMQQILTQVVEHSVQTFSVENISQAVMYKLTDNKLGSSIGMLRSSGGSLASKLGGGKLPKRKEGQSLKDYMYENDLMEEGHNIDMSFLGKESEKAFNDMSYNFTHVLGDSDEFDMSIDKVFTKSMTRLAADQVMGMQGKDITGLYKTSELSDYSLAGDSMLVFDAMKESGKSASTSFGFDTSKYGHTGDEMLEQLSNIDTRSEGQYYHVDFAQKALGVNGDDSEGLGIYNISIARGGKGFLRTAFEEGHKGGGSHSSEGFFGDVEMPTVGASGKSLHYSGMNLDALTDLEKSVGETNSFTDLVGLSSHHYGGGSHSSSGSFDVEELVEGKNTLFDKDEVVGGIKSTFSIDNFKNAATNGSMDLNELMGTGFDNIDIDSMMSDSGIDFVSDESKVNQIMSESKVDVPDIKELGMDFGTDDTTNEPLISFDKKEASESFNTAEADKLAKAIKGASEEIDLLSETPEEKATLTDFLSKINDEPVDIEDVEKDLTVTHDIGTFEEFIDQVEKLKKENGGN